MKQVSKIILSASFAAALLVGCGGGGSADPLAEAQDIAKNFKGVWVIDSANAGGIKGCVNDEEDGDSYYVKLTINEKIIADREDYSELNCDPDSLQKSVTRTYDYTIEAKNSAKTKNGTNMYGIDLILTAVNYNKGTFTGNDSSTGKKAYSIIGKNDKNLLFLEGVNDKEKRDKFLENNVSKLNDSDDIIAKLIKK